MVGGLFGFAAGWALLGPVLATSGSTPFPLLAASRGTPGSVPTAGRLLGGGPTTNCSSLCFTRVPFFFGVQLGLWAFS